MALTNQQEIEFLKTVTNTGVCSKSSFYKEYEVRNMNKAINNVNESTNILTCTNRNVVKKQKNTIAWCNITSNKDAYTKQYSDIYVENIADNDFRLQQHGNDDNNKKKNNNKNNDEIIVLDDDADAEVETDSLASMETLSDNVAIWVDGERHWISGVDENTTCQDLICALLNYQNGQQMLKSFDNEHNPDNLNDYHGRCEQRKFFNNNCTAIGGNNAINQSMPTKVAKEEQTQIERIQTQQHHKHENITTKSTSISNQTTTLAMMMARSVALASEYVIVKQHRHCEEYLDGSTKVFDILPVKVEGVIVPAKKECELFLRHLAGVKNITTTTASPQNINNTQVASLLSTDKDSGMGSPVGSSRSARFRRRKHKSTSTWLAQGNTLHPKATHRSIAALSGNFSVSSVAAIAANADEHLANEHLMRIILTQDETIHRQLTLLREKERQISKIEEEKHRTRERELGKNYLLETYLKGLDEAVCEEGDEDDEEIFIDEPYQRKSENLEKKLVAPEKSTQRQYSAITRHKHGKHTSNHHSNTSRKPIEHPNGLQSHGVQSQNEADGCVGVELNADVTPNDNQQEIELQIFWLEKVYTLNKQLQCEEETLLKLYAKIRKHQVRCAYQMKNDVLQQIDELDTKLALQCADICHVENNLITASEQLKKKLNTLEKLHTEFQEIPEKSTTEIENFPKSYTNSTKINHVVDDDVIELAIYTPIDVEIDKLEMKPRKRKPIVESSNCIENSAAAPITRPDVNTNDVEKNSLADVVKKSFAIEQLQKSKNHVIDTGDEASVLEAVITPLATPTEIVTKSKMQKEHDELIYELLSNSTESKLQHTQLLHNYPISHFNQSEQPLPTVDNTNTTATTAAVITPPMATTIAHLHTDKNTLLALQATNAKIIKKPMNEALSHNPMPTATTLPTTLTTTTTITASTTQSNFASNHSKSEHNMQTSQTNQQKSAVGGTLTSYIGSLTVPLKEVNSIDISRLGTLV